MLSVSNMHFMLSVIILNVVMLNFVMLSIVAPFKLEGPLFRQKKSFFLIVDHSSDVLQV
jgi:hypothetical protein